MKPLTNQQKQVYEYLKAHPHSTVREMNRGIFPGVDKVSARLSELADKGIKIEKHGRNKYREMVYSIGQPLTKQKSTFVPTMIDGQLIVKEIVTTVEV